MRITVCGSAVVISLFIALPAMAQAPAPAGPPPAPPAYGPPPPGYYPPPPGAYYPPPPPQNQERTAFNSLYIEGLGPGFFYSFNYDRIISDIALRVGFGYISISAGTNTTNGHAYWLAIPFDVNYIGIGSKKHIFEIGGGGTVLAIGAGGSSLGVDSNANESATYFFGHLIAGYRLQPPEGGFMLRTGISPIIGHGVFLPWPYIALGGTF